MPLIPALGMLRQEALCESQAILVYIGSSKTVRATQRNLVSKQNKTKQKQTNKKTKQ